MMANAEGAPGAAVLRWSRAASNWCSEHVLPGAQDGNLGNIEDAIECTIHKRLININIEFLSACHAVLQLH